MGALATVHLQAGHAAWTSYSGRQYPAGGGAPGEAEWAWQLAHRIKARLLPRGVSTTITGQWYDLPPPPEATAPAALFISLHYDAAIYGAGQNTGAFGDVRRYDGMPDPPRAFVSTWESLYTRATGIPIVRRQNANTSRYYAYAAVKKAPACLLEHGCGSLSPVGPYPPGQDAAVLHTQPDVVAAADAAAILHYLAALGLIPAAPEPPVPEPPPTPTPTPEPEAPDAMNLMTDEQIIAGPLSDLYGWAGIPYNPGAGITKAWVAALRDGAYPGRPRTEERPYGEGDDAGVWQECDRLCLWYRHRDGAVSWTG